MSVQLFEWVARDEPTYGKFGKVYLCYVADMHVGSVRVAKAELLSPSQVICVMHKREENVFRCPDGVPQGKAWVQAEFMEWFRQANKIAWAWLKEQQEGNNDPQG